MGLTLSELRIIDRVLRLDYSHAADRVLAQQLIEREIKVKSLNPVTGEYDEGETSGDASNNPNSRHGS